MHGMVKSAIYEQRVCLTFLYNYLQVGYDLVLSYTYMILLLGAVLNYAKYS